MSVSEDQEKYPNRYALADGGKVYEQPWNKSDAEQYLNEWHNNDFYEEDEPVEEVVDAFENNNTTTSGHVKWHHVFKHQMEKEEWVNRPKDIKWHNPSDWTTSAFDTEERITDPVTGGEKGRKVCEPAFVDPVALEALGRVAGKGRRKYDKHNYLHGYDWSLSANALQRHFLAFWSGEDYDEESGELHMAHAAWHALALVSFLARGLGNDDRPPDWATGEWRE